MNTAFNQLKPRFHLCGMRYANSTKNGKKRKSTSLTRHVRLRMRFEKVTKFWIQPSDSSIQADFPRKIDNNLAFVIEVKMNYSMILLIYLKCIFYNLIIIYCYAKPIINLNTCFYTKWVFRLM